MKAGKPEQLDMQPIGTGPFQLVQYQKDSLIRFRAFRDFWGKAGGMPERAPKVDNLVFSITPDPAVRLAKLRAGECQIARYPNAADIDSIRATPGLTVQQEPSPRPVIWRCAPTSKPFDDVRVRRALAMAIDLNSLVKAVYQGTGTPTAAARAAHAMGPQSGREAVSRTIPRVRRSCSPRPAIRTGSAPICGRSRWRGPICRTGGAPRR